jgi:PIN domain nuclease of toxin-antitoxin system
VSAASVWELAIKQAQGRLRLPGDFLELIEETCFRRLPITFEHGVEAGALRLHHADPFDRMLIAQARIERLTLATADASLQAYDVSILRVQRPAPAGPEPDVAR